MFGIDIGISVSSITLITSKGKVLDTGILFGNKGDRDHWTRVVDMADAITNLVREVTKNPKVLIEPLVAIEEPVQSYRSRNPRSDFNMCCLYALIRSRLEKWNYTIYSINPATAKSIAKKYLSKKGLPDKRRMIIAYKNCNKTLPNYHTIVGRETLADSYFIARAGIEKRKVALGLKREV